jgi:hypothetical protein
MGRSTSGGELLKSRFEQDGFAAVPGVLSPERVAGLRADLDEYFMSTGPGAEMTSTDFLARPKLWRIVFADLVVDSMHQLLHEGYTIYPNMTVRKSLYVGWHVDTAFYGPANPHVWDRDFAHVQGAIYLQDNDVATGGGLDLVKGSHRAPLPGLRGDHLVSRLIASVLNSRIREKVMLRAKAGDLVLWHARTLHRSTPAQSESMENDRITKYGIFFSCGRNDAYAEHRYLTHLVGQAVQREDHKPKFVPRYRDILDVRYPGRFPPEFRAEVHRCGVSVATF